MRKLIAVVAAVTLMISLAACGAKTETPAAQQGAAPAQQGAAAGGAGAEPAKELQPVKIGIIGARSGAAATLGQYLDGAIAAFRNINDQGGVGGYKIEYVLRDDEANPTKSAELTKELLYKEKVVAIIGPTNTSNGLAILPLIFEAKVPLIDPVATGSALMPKALELAKGGPNWFFMTTTSDNVQAGRLVKYLLDHKFTRPAVLHDDTGYGKGGGSLLVKELEKAGIKPVAVIAHN